MNARFLAVTIVKDMRRRLRDLPALLLWLGVPLMVGSLISLLATGDSVVPRAHLLLVDQDQTFLSGLVAGAAGQGGLAEFLEIEPVELDEGRERMDAGDATAMLVLPAGFSNAVLLQEPATLTLVTNPAQRILPSIVREGLEILVEGIFYLQRSFGGPLQLISEGPPDDEATFDNEAISAISILFNENIQQLQGMLFPPVLTVMMATDTPDEADAREINLGSLFLPGMIFMSILFIAGGMAGDIWDEKEAGTLQRLTGTPQSPATLLAAKLVVAAVLFAAAAALGLLIGTWAFDLPWATVLPAIAWTAYVGVCLFCLFLVAQTLASTKRTAGMVESMLLFPLMMIGGSFFPFAAMPDWMIAIGRWTPNGQGVLVLQAILGQTLDAATLATATTVIGAIAMLAFGYCVRRLSGPFLRS